MTNEEKACAYDQICEIINNVTDIYHEKILFAYAFINGIYWKTGLSDKIYKAEPKSLRYFNRERKSDETSFIRVIDSDLALGKNFGFKNYGYDWAINRDDIEVE